MCAETNISAPKSTIDYYTIFDLSELTGDKLFIYPIHFLEMTCF